jgi:hypothetical protein
VPPKPSLHSDARVQVGRLPGDPALGVLLEGHPSGLGIYVLTTGHVGSRLGQPLLRLAFLAVGEGPVFSVPSFGEGRDDPVRCRARRSRPKSVERWITTNRTPHWGHRWKAASFLGVDEVYVWPSVEKQAEKASASELITYYPHRGAVPAPLWSSLIEKATDQVDILVYAGLFLFDSQPDLPDPSWPRRRRLAPKSASFWATRSPQLSGSVAKRRASATT